VPTKTHLLRLLPRCNSSDSQIRRRTAASNQFSLVTSSPWSITFICSSYLTLIALHLLRCSVVACMRMHAMPNMRPCLRPTSGPLLELTPKTYTHMCTQYSIQDISAVTFRLLATRRCTDDTTTTLAHPWLPPRPSKLRVLGFSLACVPQNRDAFD
jgi:hypothetical protein